MRTCPNCHLLIENDAAIFCKKCGSKLSSEPQIIFKEPQISEIQNESLKDDKVISGTTSGLKTIPRKPNRPNINGFFAFVLWMIVIGGVLSSITGIITFDLADYYNSIGLILSDLSIYILTPLWAIYSVVSTYKGRSGAITLLKSYLIFVLVYKFFAMLLNGDVTTLFGIIWNIVYIAYVMFSNNVEENFPKADRKTTAFDKMLIYCCILIPIVTLIIGMF